MPLTAEQTAIVKSTAPILKEHGETITTLFYKNMIEANPDLRNIFNLSNQHTGAQPRALAHAVLAYATYIDNLAVLGPAVERIAHKHVSLCVTPDQYAIVGKHLLEAIVAVLGDAVTPAVADAWQAAYAQLADLFVKLEGDMYDQAGDWRGWRKFRISRREQESSTVTSFYFVPVDGATPLPKFRPGQYVSLRVKVPAADNVYQCRQYSMSDAPAGDHYRVSIKRENPGEADPSDSSHTPGVVSNLLHDSYQVGDEVEITYPRGEFFVDVNDESKAEVPLVLLSAGVGVTPLKSILDAVLESGSKTSQRPIRWIQAARNTQEMPLARDVRRIAEQKENVSMVVFVKNVGDGDQQGKDYDHEGRMDLQKLDKEKDLSLRDPKTEYCLCGPQTWMLAVKGSLLEMGVERENIKMEYFGTGDAEIV